MRFVTPLVFAAAGAWVAVNNADPKGRTLVLPLLDGPFPSVVDQGAWSVRILLGLAAVFAAWDGFQWWRERNPEDP